MGKILSSKSSDSNHEAILSNDGANTIFYFSGCEIRFSAPYSLERYTEVVSWDNGYLIVMAQYSHNAKPEEEYIDLKSILKEKGIDPVSFLKPIKTVRIA